nr:hypothetical protein [uncultured Carboxylicivirga sp.]
MKNGILIICITLILIQCSSPDKHIYLSYYRMINNAEYSLFEGDTLQAIAQYEKATKMVERPFLRDFRTLISIKIKSFDTIDINETME